VDSKDRSELNSYVERLLGILFILLPLHNHAADTEVLELSLTASKQSYMTGEPVEVTLSMKRGKILQSEIEGKVTLLMPLLLFCGSPYMNFHFEGEPPLFIAPKRQHTETDFDVYPLQLGDELIQSIDLSKCYQLEKGKYTLYAVFNPKQKRETIYACDEYASIFKERNIMKDFCIRYIPVSGWGAKSQSITIEIIE